MKPWALVPVKRFDQGKSRLGDVLDAAARAELARGLFDRGMGVLVPLAGASELSGVLVVTDGEEVAERAAAHGAEGMLSAGVGPGRALGAIVDEALAALAARGAGSVVVLMGDLPAVAADDVRALVALLGDTDVVLAPDEARTGTNALAMRLPAPMPTRFCGGESLAAHLAEAQGRGLRAALCERRGLRIDIDRPEDYRLFHSAVN
jgi:2-phospho-L-lactate guanylyltransferase